MLASASRDMPTLVAINVSEGGIPKLPVPRAELTEQGLVGDGRAHAKHVKSSRAVSLLDQEILDTLCLEGYSVGPGVLGENLTVLGLSVQELSTGARLRFEGGVELELSEPRKPCYVLDAVDPRLKTVVVNRIGWMARVVVPGWLSVDEQVTAYPGTNP